MTDPSLRIGNEMIRPEIDSLLRATGHGVLSMGNGDRGYGVPLSFGYDRENERIVLAFVNAPDSKKQRFVDATEEVTLTVYNYEDPDSWESVVVTGTIHTLDDADVSDRFASLFFAQADDAAGEHRWLDLDDLERRWYEIRITDVSGRHSGRLLHRESPD